MTQRPVAIVTGASRGIGKAIALELARLGYDMAVNRVQDAVPDTKAEVEALGVRCEFVQGDVAKAQDRTRMVETMKEKFGRCDMLVNNAGVAPLKRMDILESTEESFDRVMGSNLKGPYFLTQLVANWMIEQKAEHPDRTFRIVNIGSISAYATSPARGEYCISKAGLTMMTMLYADRLGEYNIPVIEVSPGVIETDMTSAVKGKYDKLIAEGLTPIKRWGQPEDIARAVGAIAEGKLDFSTGNVIDVDGGFHLRRL
ncbi:MAG: 3-ketoacyl-ACP reductase [Planctomycetota bacterium]|jgi:NAD(P)-dependent dehydrogenase (short-subunit alcohol dehydrogenase family)